MVTTEDEDVNTNDGSKDPKPNHLQIASLLQEMLQDARGGTGDGANPALTKILEFAAQEFGIERDDVAEGRGNMSREKSTGSQSGKKQPTFTCGHLCCDHKEVMNPNLWGTLPQELLQLVFARLSVDEISHLQFLNKGWKQIMATTEFYRECDEVQPKMLCLITRDPMTQKFWVRVLDMKCPSEWHTYQIVAGYPDYLNWTPECEDGGLVCFVTRLNLGSSYKDTRPTLFLNVVNPLKRILHELPPLCDVRASIFQIKVDRRTKAYKVFVVADRIQWEIFGYAGFGSWRSTGVVTVQIYDSLMGEWTTAHESSDLIFSFRHQNTWAYDFADGGRFLHLNGDGCPLTRGFISSARHKDHFFVLRLGTDGPANDESSVNHSATYYIEEFHCQLRGASWLKANTHRCNPFEHPPKKPLSYFMKLFACSGFLMVFAELTPFDVQSRFENKLGWLYDLSTRKWSFLDLPHLPVGKRRYSEDSQMFTVELPGGQKRTINQDSTYSVDLICEPQWAV